ncbi:MAG: hypothetical protein WA857_08980 [Candidatus Acidiferrum sp.]
MTKTTTYPLRLPRSLKKAVESQSKEDGTSINQFVATAVAEKISALQTAEFFATRKARADFKAFDKLMKRRRGQPPRPGDEISRREIEPLKLSFRLTLDPATYGDQNTVAALRNVLPPPFQPDVSVAVHLTESAAGGRPLLALTIIGSLWWIGKNVIVPAGKKAVGPPLEEVGEWLRDMIRQFRKRGKAVPDAVTLRIERPTQPTDISIGIPIRFLWKSQQLSALDSQLAEALPSFPIFANADKLMLSWNRERETWVCTIWPINMASTHECFVYDLKTGQCEKIKL